jgi:hypothetical protein
MVVWCDTNHAFHIACRIRQYDSEEHKMEKWGATPASHITCGMQNVEKTKIKGSFYIIMRNLNFDFKT